jgi:hypothetical protein
VIEKPYDMTAYSAKLPWLAWLFGKRYYAVDDGYFCKGILWDRVLYMTDNGPIEPLGDPTPSDSPTGEAGK